MRSDRNLDSILGKGANSLVDWEMRSDRNVYRQPKQLDPSLVDWEMRSDRNYTFALMAAVWESSRLGNAL